MHYRLLVNIREIKEVRLGWQSKEFSDRRDDDLKRFGADETCSFIILHGTEFRLKMMSLVGGYVLCSGLLCSDNCYSSVSRRERCLG